MSWPVHRAGRGGDDEGWHGGFGRQPGHGLNMMNVGTAGAQDKGGELGARNYPCGLFLALSFAGTSWAAVAHAVAAD